jgi:hypothetical protein
LPWAITELGLGARVPFKRLQLDKSSFEIFKKFLFPTTISSIKEEVGQSGLEVEKFCNHLLKEGLLIPYQVIPESYNRFDRHLEYYSLNGLDPIKVQDSLKNKSITLLGMGGIGNWIALNFVGLGIKKIRLIDPDIIEESNLTRQMLFSEKDVGQFKVDIAEQRLKERNGDLIVESFKENLTENNISELIAGTDFVVLSADKPFFSAWFK